MSQEGGIPRLEFRVPRLRASFRFTYAFHAREVRFEHDLGEGYRRAFPETFSFHADRHDPAELFLRLDDLWSNPRRLAEGATRRDAEELVLRLLQALPGYLEGTLDRLAEAGRDPAPLRRACEDVAVFVQVLQRFLDDKELAGRPRLRMAALHLRRLLLRCLQVAVDVRVSPEFLARYERGQVDPPASTDPHDVSFYYALAEADPETLEPVLVGAAERAYLRWLEDVCLDEENRAFEGEDSPFDEREVEVMRAVTRADRASFRRASDLAIFLCRPGNRDALRLLKKLETWFLRQYDVGHAAVVIHHAANLHAGRKPSDRVLSRLSNKALALGLGFAALPFLLAIPFYASAPRFFDAWASAEVAAVIAGAFWFLGYRFMWCKDLTLFHASVPRIGAGIIVGYLPVFLIDEVWDLAEQSPFYLFTVVAMLGSTTLLYIYVEVQRRLGDPGVAFSRAAGVFLLGLVEAAAFGLLVTSLLGPLMAARNWGPPAADHSLGALRVELAPFLGELPRITGLEALPAFPTAVLLMSFLAFFIGTFLQLLWEELPITEPL